MDKKLIYSLGNKRIPNFRQLKHLPKILKPKERATFTGLVALVIVSVIFIVTTFYLRNFLPTPTVGGEYVEGLIGAPQYINPILSQTNDVDSDIARLIFSGLLKYDSELQLVPDLAASWEASEDQKTYTFTLKQGIKWHDGQTLDADDVIFTFQSIQDPDFKSPLLISFRGVTIQKIDDLTVKFTLPEVFPAFLEVLTFGILPEHIWGTIPAINANLTEYNLKPVGSGPWKFKSLAKDRLGNIKSYVLVPNPDYYGPQPYIEKLTFNFYPDFQTAVVALKNNSAEGISFLPKEFKSQLAGEKSLNFNSFYLPQYTAVFFNQKENEALKEKSVRQALAYGIDKSKILSEALGLEGEIIDGPILPIPIEQNSDKKINFDVAKANQLLEDAGWKQITPQQYQEYLAKKTAATNQDTATTTAPEILTPTTTTEDAQAKTETETEEQGFYRQKGENILTITLTTVNQPENSKAAELIKEFWEAIGVKVNLVIVEGSKIRREVIKTRNYEALLFGIIVGSNPDPYPFWHSSQIQDPGLNLALFANREVDKLLEEAKITENAEEQVQKYQRFQEILATELPAIFLHTPTYSYVVDKKIKGINIGRVIIPADRFNNIQDWYIKTERRYQGDIH
ncbi:MAG: hypothetical protein HUU49_02990 [Candidatus Buchananbacteria bacterium]|nr:hypothetical protein [Candidatus Buchananbacteria bacterium]